MYLTFMFYVYFNLTFNKYYILFYFGFFKYQIHLIARFEKKSLNNG